LEHPIYYHYNIINFVQEAVFSQIGNDGSKKKTIKLITDVDQHSNISNQKEKDLNLLKKDIVQKKPLFVNKSNVSYLFLI